MFTVLKFKLPVHVPNFLSIAGCINLPGAPTGSWFCKLCQNLSLNEKHVEHNTNALAAGRVLGIDSIEQITNRCIRIMNTGEIEFGGCALCGYALIFSWSILP